VAHSLRVRFNTR